MRGSDFIFDSVQLIYYKCHQANFRRGGSYIDSPNWIKKKKATINPKCKDDKFFQYPITVALNYGETVSNPERVSNIKPYINKYKWKWINYPSKTDDWKTSEKSNSPIALNILYIEEKKLCPAHISKIDLNCGKQIILLIIPNEEKEAIAVKKLSTLLRGITLKSHGDFHCLTCLHSFRTGNKLKSHDKVCKNKDFCGIVMPSEKDNILEFNPYMKSDKMTYIIYVTKIITEINGCVNNPKNSSTTKNRRACYLWIFNVNNLCIY